MPTSSDDDLPSLSDSIADSMSSSSHSATPTATPSMNASQEEKDEDDNKGCTYKFIKLCCSKFLIFYFSKNCITNYSWFTFHFVHDLVG